MADSSEQIFKYRFISKHKGLLWGVVYFIPGLGGSVYGTILNKGQTLLGLSIIWAVLTPLILLAIWKEKTDQAELSEIKISVDGISAHLRKNDLEYSPKKNVQFVPWSSIDGYQYFSYPDPDAHIMAGKAGVRLMIKEMDRKICIYENIKDYESLLKVIKSKLPRQ